MVFVELEPFLFMTRTKKLNDRAVRRKG